MQLLQRPRFPPQWPGCHCYHGCYHRHHYHHRHTPPHHQAQHIHRHLFLLTSMKALCWADSNRTWSTCNPSAVIFLLSNIQVIIAVIFSLSNQIFARVKDKSVLRGAFILAAPGQLGLPPDRWTQWDLSLSMIVKKMKLIAIWSIYDRHTIAIWSWLWCSPAPKSFEILREARGSLSSSDPRMENLGRVTFSLSIWVERHS